MTTDFQREYAEREGVQRTESGLLYLIDQPGDDNNKPKPQDRVEVHYRGTLVDGTEFDSSYARGKTAVFPLNGVIAGWTEGLQLIGVGGSIELVIPPELAYGKEGAGAMIGPNQVLIFQVDLLSIVK